MPRIPIITGQSVTSEYLRKIESGAAITVEAQLLQEDGETPYDLTGKTVRAEIRRIDGQALAYSGAATVEDAEAAHVKIDVPQGELIQDDNTTNRTRYGLVFVVEDGGVDEEFFPTLGKGDVGIYALGQDKRSLDIAKQKAADAERFASDAEQDKLTAAQKAQQTTEDRAAVLADRTATENAIKGADPADTQTLAGGQANIAAIPENLAAMEEKREEVEARHEDITEKHGQIGVWHEALIPYGDVSEARLDVEALAHQEPGSPVVLVDGTETEKASAFAYQDFLARLAAVDIEAQANTSPIDDALGEETALYQLGRLYKVLLDMLTKVSGSVAGLDGAEIAAKSMVQYLADTVAAQLIATESRNFSHYVKVGGKDALPTTNSLGGAIPIGLLAGYVIEEGADAGKVQATRWDGTTYVDEGDPLPWIGDLVASQQADIAMTQAAQAEANRIAAEAALAETALLHEQMTASAAGVVVSELPQPPGDLRTYILQDIGTVYHNLTRWRRINVVTGAIDDVPFLGEHLYALWDFADSGSLGRDRLGNLHLGATNGDPAQGAAIEGTQHEASLVLAASEADYLRTVGNFVVGDQSFCFVWIGVITGEEGATCFAIRPNDPTSMFNMGVAGAGAAVPNRLQVQINNGTSTSNRNAGIVTRGAIAMIECHYDAASDQLMTYINRATTSGSATSHTGGIRTDVTSPLLMGVSRANLTSYAANSFCDAQVGMAALWLGGLPDAGVLDWMWNTAQGRPWSQLTAYAP